MIGYWLAHKSDIYALIGCNVSNNGVLINRNTQHSTILEDDVYHNLERVAKNIFYENYRLFNTLASAYDDVMENTPLDYLNKHGITTPV